MLNFDYKYDRLSIQINVKIGGMSLWRLGHRAQGCGQVRLQRLGIRTLQRTDLIEFSLKKKQLEKEKQTVG